jgi:ABC-type antimicrobial peptide transport system permease subunit
MLADLLNLAWMNMRRARLRLLMTGAGVLVGTAAVILLIALSIGLQQAAESSVGSNAILTEITIFPSELSTFDENRPLLNAESLTTFQNIEGVVAVVPLLSLGGRAEFRSDNLSNYAEVYGIPPEGLPQMNISAASGNLSLETGQAIFGANIPLYFLDPEASEFTAIEIDVFNSPMSLNLLSLEGDERSIPLEVTAVLAPETSRFDNAVFLNFDDILAHQSWVNGAEPDLATLEYNQVLIRTSSRETTNLVRDEIAALGYAVDSVGDFLDDLNNFFATMRLVLGATGGIALLVAAFVVANTMMMSVLERTSEIGLMKAVGARDSDVLLLFLLEAGLVGFAGGIAGVGLAFFLANSINQAIINAQLDGSAQLGFLPLNPAMIQGELLLIPNELALLAISIATLVGLAAGFFPAWRAARMSPVKALKS